MFPWLRDSVKALVGRCLSDHPTSNEITTFAHGIGNVGLSGGDHAKIIFYPRGLRDGNNQILYPFNVEMNINHEYRVGDRPPCHRHAADAVQAPLRRRPCADLRRG
jgi:hypothetical protein